MPPAPPRAASVMDLAAAAVAQAYVEAILELVPDNRRAEEIAQELEQVIQLTERVDGFHKLLTGGGLSARRQSQLVENVFAGRCSREVEGLLAVMARNGRLGLLWQVVSQFRSRLDRRCGKVEVTVVAAAELDQADRKALLDALTELTGATPLLRTEVDPSLLGGVVVRVGDRQYDASVAGALGRLRRKLSLAVGTAVTRLSQREEA